MTKQTMVVVALCVGAGSVVTMSSVKPRTAAVTAQAVAPVDAALAAKAESSCWFKVRNRSDRAEEVKQWRSVTSLGAKAERHGDLVIVSGAMEPAVRDARFYGCSLFEYTEGSPVVMTVKTSSGPLGAANLVPFGFSADGKKQQR